MNKYLRLHTANSDDTPTRDNDLSASVRSWSMTEDELRVRYAMTTIDTVNAMPNVSSFEIVFIDSDGREQRLTSGKVTSVSIDVLESDESDDLIKFGLELTTPPMIEYTYHIKRHR